MIREPIPNSACVPFLFHDRKTTTDPILIMWQIKKRHQKKLYFLKFGYDFYKLDGYGQMGFEEAG